MHFFMSCNKLNYPCPHRDSNEIRKHFDAMDHIATLNEACREHFGSKHEHDRWVLPDSRALPCRQKPYKSRLNVTLNPEVPFAVDGMWTLQRAWQARQTTYLPIILLPELPTKVFQEWKSRTVDVKPESFAKAFHDCHEGARYLDVLWIIRKIEQVSQGKPRTLAAIPPRRQVDINEQQSRLFRDCRVMNLMERFQRSTESSSPTYYSRLAPVCLHILENGKAAQTSENQEDADFLALDQDQFHKWLVNGSGDKVILFRNRPWWNSRPVTSVDKVLRGLISIGFDVDVQDLGRNVEENENSTVRLPISTVVQRFQLPTQYPINLLNLECTGENLVPEPIAFHCGLLLDAVSVTNAHSQHVLDRNMSAAGKRSKALLTKAVDIQSCMKFEILGQAGVFSGWHIDNMGVSTWVTLEDHGDSDPSITRNEPGFDDTFYSLKSDEEVLKLWAIVRQDHLSKAKKRQIRESFIRDGELWKPDSSLIKVISLVRGDTLMMPPGTIHAPITVTDCLFRGGMVMQDRHARQSIRQWKFVSDNDTCTNEDKPRQTRGVIDSLRDLIRADPILHGYGEEGSLDELENDWRAISRDALTCNCGTGCRNTRCNCYSSGQRCDAGCHKSSNCSNPFGCRIMRPSAGNAPGKVEQRR